VDIAYIDEVLEENTDLDARSRIEGLWDEEINLRPRRLGWDGSRRRGRDRSRQRGRDRQNRRRQLGKLPAQAYAAKLVTAQGRAQEHERRKGENQHLPW